MTVVKPLYGIAEAGTHWWSTYFKHHRDHLGMTTSSYDPCLLVIKQDSDLFGVVGMQTDNTLILCDDQFSKLEEEELAKARFIAKLKEKLDENTMLYFNSCAIKMENDVITMT